METQGVKEEHEGGRDWRGFLRRRWPVVSGAVALALVAGWLLFRGNGPEPAVAASAAQPAASDSLVALDSTAERLAGIELADARPAISNELAANGTIAYDENLVSIVAPRAEGRLLAVRADLGQRVEKGAALAVLSSPDVGKVRGDFERARATVDVARRNYERERRLFEQSISPEKEMLDAEVLYRTAEADLKSAAAQLRSLGASVGTGGDYTLTAPISGSVVERAAMPGQVVGPQSNLFTVADLSHVWISVDVYDADLGRVRQGANARVTATSFPGAVFPGKVTYGGGVVDTTTHTFRIRVEVENHALKLRPGMYTRVVIETVGAAVDSTRLVVPEVAVQTVGGASAVFVPAGPRRYVVRRVSVVAATQPGTALVTSGLRPGERVVGKGAFQLASELNKASFGGEE